MPTLLARLVMPGHFCTQCQRSCHQNGPSFLPTDAYSLYPPQATHPAQPCSEVEWQNAHGGVLKQQQLKIDTHPTHTICVC